MGYADRALRTLSAGNRTLLRAGDEERLLREMCRVIVEDGGYRMAWVGFAEHDEQQTIRPVAHHGFEAGYFDLARFTWADGDRGPTSEAVRTGRPSVLQDVLSRVPTQLAVPLTVTLGQGYAAAAAFPLITDGQVIGNLTILAGERDAFDAQEVALLGELADDLAYGLSTLRMRARHREAEETIRHMAFFDSLTSLPNRASLLLELTSAINKTQVAHTPLAMLIIKIGDFQEIGDTLGYQEADLLVLEMSRRLTQIAGQGPSIARVGEDEFGMVLPGTGAEEALRVAQRILNEVCDPVRVGGLSLDPHAVVGIAMCPGHGNTADVIMRRARVAAVQARRTPEKYSLYVGSVDQERTRRLALMSDLRKAIAQNNLLLYCQPKVSVATGEACGAEALVRWQHPQHGMVAPSEFISLAERAGLIILLTRWVLEAAFRVSHDWYQLGLRQPLSVNLSAEDLRDPKLVSRISNLFATWAMPPDMIQFELTESALMDDPIGSMQTLDRLKGLGVELSIDDFGTGYSSLSYLQKLPVDALKIDQSFVANMLSNDDSAVIVRSTVELGHNLGLGVIAEGVESEAQWEGLGALGCDTVQGYFVGKPIPVEQFVDWEKHSRWHGKSPLPRVKPTAVS